MLNKQPFLRSVYEMILLFALLQTVKYIKQIVAGKIEIQDGNMRQIFQD